ncbi:MAG: PEP-CTERM sorting domain-containing protein [Planctomycetes bacterium]|nr:PEP-CTERM sorting domain-containing protein [Planctomycetota bacterium]
MTARRLVECVALIGVFGFAVDGWAQVNISPDTTNSSNQTVGTAGSTGTGAFVAYWNFGTTFPSTTATGSSGTQIRYTVSGTGGTIVTGSPTATNPSSGYSLASGTAASGQQNYGLAASYPAIVSGSSSPGFTIVMQSPPIAANYLYDLESVQLGTRSAASGPTGISLRWDQNDYKLELASASVSADSSWSAINLTPTVPPAFQQTIALFGTGGSGSSAPNWQIDDLWLAGTLHTTTGAAQSVATYGISGAGSGTFSGNFSISGTATLNLQSGGTVAITGPVTGYLGRIDKTGAGTLVLTNSNAYYYDTVISQGKVVGGNPNAFGLGKIAVNDGATLDLGGYAVTNQIVTRNNATILNAGNYAGVQLVSTGTTTYPQAVSGTMTVADGAKAVFDGAFSGKADLTGTAAFNQAMSGILALAGSGSASFADVVSGSVALSGSAAKAVFANTSLITGTVKPSDGAVSVISGTVDPAAAVSVGQSGTVQFGSGLKFQQPTLPNAGLVEMTNSGSTGLSTSITGTGAFTMAGTGLTSLSGSSSFTGGTDITSGTLAAGNPHALGQGPVDVADGGKLVIDAALALGGTNAITLAGTNSKLQSMDGATAPIAGNSPLGGVTSSGSASGSSPASAALLAGAASATGGLLSTDWTSVGKPASAVSEILELLTPTGSSVFVLSMNYDAAAENPNLWLGWNSGTSGWVNAIDGNFGNNASVAQQAYVGSFAAFQNDYGTTLATYVGAYGRDQVGDTVWAVVNHNSEFVALVPEPATLAVLVAAVGVATIYRRRR